MWRPEYPDTQNSGDAGEPKVVDGLPRSALGTEQSMVGAPAKSMPKDKFPSAHGEPGYILVTHPTSPGWALPYVKIKRSPGRGDRGGGRKGSGGVGGQGGPLPLANQLSVVSAALPLPRLDQLLDPARQVIARTGSSGRRDVRLRNALVRSVPASSSNEFSEALRQGHFVLDHGAIRT
jgi:hypothetical protein